MSIVRPTSSLPAVRRGYSFPEIMFAVVVLGIGFIMLAAIFPVAVRQSKLTGDETRAMGIARGVEGFVTGLAEGSDPSDDEFYAAWLTQDRSQGIDTSNKNALYPPWKKPKLTEDGLPLYIGDAIFPPTGAGADQWFTKPGNLTFNNTGTWPDANEKKRNITLGYYPFAGQAYPLFTKKAWDLIRGNVITDNDTRFAWTILYRRDGYPNWPPSTWSPVVQLYILVSQSRNTSTFDSSPYGVDIGQWWNDWDQNKKGVKGVLPMPVPYSYANLFPRFIQVKLTNNWRDKSQPDGVGPDAMEFNSADVFGGNAAISEGCYVVTRGRDPEHQHPAHVYQLGSQVAKNTYELLPGNDMKDSQENSPDWELAYVLGRQRTFNTNNPQKITPVYSGPAQDVYMYTCIIPIKKSS